MSVLKTNNQISAFEFNAEWLFLTDILRRENDLTGAPALNIWNAIPSLGSKEREHFYSVRKSRWNMVGLHFLQAFSTNQPTEETIGTLFLTQLWSWRRLRIRSRVWHLIWLFMRISIMQKSAVKSKLLWETVKSESLSRDSDMIEASVN